MGCPGRASASATARARPAAPPATSAASAHATVSCWNSQLLGAKPARGALRFQVALRVKVEVFRILVAYGTQHCQRLEHLLGAMTARGAVVDSY